MKELVLGTAQLGLNYGINNDLGKPNETQAFDILDFALKNNIKIIDTAGAYGNSEQIIGKYLFKHKDAFKIATKLPKLNNIEDIEKSIKNSISNLGILSIDYYLVHSFKDIIENTNLINILTNYKEKGIIKNVGISIYEPNELEYILEKLSNYISVVQIPFNILDNRWIKSDLLKKARHKGIDISCRSIYLQGLFFADEKKINSIHSDGIKYINYIRKIANEKKVDLKTILLNYVKIQTNIDYILIGCEKVQQLKENIEIFNKNICISEKDIEEIVKFTKDIPNKIIDPRSWNE
jgi:aryl-alcohol dehydrogenase-like predicted oxidoreductase